MPLSAATDRVMLHPSGNQAECVSLSMRERHRDRGWTMRLYSPIHIRGVASEGSIAAHQRSGTGQYSDCLALRGQTEMEPIETASCRSAPCATAVLASHDAVAVVGFGLG
jgi:hypothetical protein